MSSPEQSRLQKRSVTIAGHKTSVSLETAFWEALVGEARRRGISVSALVAEIDGERTGNLSSALRVFVLESALRPPFRVFERAQQANA